MIHRFMTTKMDDLPEVKLTEDRCRKISGSDGDEGNFPLATVKRRPTRSLTEVRPDAYIFDDGLHFEVRTVPEDDEEEETSISKPAPAQSRLNLLGERQRSSESRTSVLSSISQSESDISGEDITQLSLDQIRMRHPARRDSTGRRNSEGGDSNPTRIPRQLSQTHSEPDGGSETRETSRVTFAEPRIMVVPPPIPKNARAALMAMHTEYTSITDELESVCGLLSPPRTPRLLSPPRPGQILPRRRCTSEMSNPEKALHMEKEHLRHAEENDYQLMENLIKRQYEDSDEYDQQPYQTSTLLSVVHETREFRSSARSLRRASAVDGDVPVFTVAVDTTLHVPDSKHGPGTSERQDSGESAHTDSSHDETALLVPSQLPPRPSIVVDSSLLPTLQRELPKADSKASLHMQSETMC